MSLTSAAEGVPGERGEAQPLAIRIGHFLFKRRKFVFPLASLAILLLARPRLLFGSEAWDRLLDILGISLALAGQALRALVIGLVYIKRGGESGSIHAETLVVEGGFAHCRNPLYLGNLMGFTGLFLILNAPMGYLVGIPFFYTAYYCIVVAEEDFLRRRFGADFEDYCRRVPRFFISFRGLRATVGNLRFNWRRLIRKEYGTAFVSLTMLLGLLAYQSWWFQGWPAARPALIRLLALWLPLPLAYATARYFKKSGRLGRS
ncbi:MAG TPA: methyltransferase [Candidatus Polarisedimenticolia bacterium]|nr:methyltransferase [Candidatus Polarisedimenticolia bacterium]